ncbi:hypothetical protein BJX96DRAFT_81979 [Aspergillus floccosus]
MKYKGWYPHDFITAARNRLTEDQIAHHLRQPTSAPRFLYGALMLPTVLKYFLSINQTVDIVPRMTPAILRGYRLYQFSETSTPVIVPAPNDPGATVEGMLVFGLDCEQRNALYEIEAGLMQLAEVQVQIPLMERVGAHEMSSTLVVDAGTFVWQGLREGLIRVAGSMWSLDGFLTGLFYRHIVDSQQRQSLDE